MLAIMAMVLLDTQCFLVTHIPAEFFPLISPRSRSGRVALTPQLAPPTSTADITNRLPNASPLSGWSLRKPREAQLVDGSCSEMEPYCPHLVKVCVSLWSSTGPKLLFMETEAIWELFDHLSWVRKQSPPLEASQMREKLSFFCLKRMGNRVRCCSCLGGSKRVFLRTGGGVSLPMVI